jgi:glycosyltransferase involved in cell wall biosynthesis
MDGTSDSCDLPLSVLAPVQNEGQSFQRHFFACLRVIAEIRIEIVLLDNQSTDGCCHGLPPDVLIVRTERVELPERLWLLGGSLASGQSVLWLPRLLSHRPEQFRKLIMSALDLGTRAQGYQSTQLPRRQRFTAASGGPNLLTPSSRSSLERWSSAPVYGFLAPAAACRFLRLVYPIKTAGPQSLPSQVRPNLGIEHVGSSAGASLSGRRSSVDQARVRLLSVIITAHNEGNEVLRTVQSIRTNTLQAHEIIVVDDGSTDGSCSGLEPLGVRVIRHPERLGVACSRDAGTKAALGDVFAFLDAHQRVGPRCLDRCAELAAAHGAITCPPCRPLGRRYPVSYGAMFRLCPERGFFSGEYRIWRPRQETTRISGLRSPGYVIPRGAYGRVGWISKLRGWGATDYSVALKAFFTDVDILHVNTDAIEHLFRKKIPYETNWQGVWRNHALIARVCFDDRTWTRYWLPEVFRANLTADVLDELDSPGVRAEHERFMELKVRPDREFWRGLLRIKEPVVLTH